MTVKGALKTPRHKVATEAVGDRANPGHLTEEQPVGTGLTTGSGQESARDW